MLITWRLLSRQVVTANRGDFAALNVVWAERARAHAGIVIIVQQQADIGPNVRRMLALQASVDAAAMRNRLEWLNNWSPAQG